MQQLLSLTPARVATLALLPVVFGSPLVQLERLDERLVQSRFAFASIGDSWAAGQGVISRDAYGGPDQYNSCYRHKSSWEALMAGDNTWTDDPIEFKYAACSGAMLQDATMGRDGKDPQMSKVARPHLLTMQMGGNNANFGGIIRCCFYVGDTVFQKDYPDPDGCCFKLIQEGELYLDGNFTSDHHDTLKKVLETELMKEREEVYLYIVGYAEFFNVKSPDSDWCNDQSFGIIKSPKLNKALRTKINELSRKINAAMARSTSDFGNDRIRFLDPSPVFENHRFCEPGHTLSNLYFLSDVWFWNMSPPEDDPVYAKFHSIPLHEAAWAQEHKFINGSVATQEQLLRLLDPASSNPLESWSGRAFHPKDGGHLAIKNAMIDYLRHNNVPGIKQAAPPPPPPKTQPYTSGQIHIHIREFWDCHDDANNLSVEITMWDGAGVQIGFMKKTQAGASASAWMGSKLEDPLVITPEWANGGYIQFQIGLLGFDTHTDTDDSKPTHCHWGGFDPRDGPTCVVAIPPNPPRYYPDALSINNIDCWFPSPEWHGRTPSDGSPL